MKKIKINYILCNFIFYNYIDRKMDEKHESGLLQEYF